MYCVKCGKENPGNNIFCEYCGERLLKAENNDNEKDQRGNKRRVIFIIAVAIVFLAVIAACVIFYLGNSGSAEYNEKVEQADRYMEDMDYEKAEAAYLEAIEIAPRENEPYLRLSEIYELQGNNEEAINILEQGETAADDKNEILERIEKLKYGQIYYDYLKESFDFPLYGLADIGEITYDDTDVNLGLVSAVLIDLDEDGIPEMLTTNATTQYDMKMKVFLYAIDDGQVVQIDFIDDGLSDGDGVSYDVNNQYSGETQDYYIKKYNDGYYLVNVSTGIYSGGSISVESIVVTPVTKDGFDHRENMSANINASRGELTIEVNDVNVLSRLEKNMNEEDPVIYSHNEEAWEIGAEAVEEALMRYGLGDKMSLKYTNESVSGTMWISFETWNDNDKSEIPLSSRKREWMGNYQSITDDFTDIREEL
ncbi:MAG: zinc-ribbon domain-containing protein [Anaerovoracaceae bacterium]